MHKVTPFLWFDTQALEAAQLYTSVFKNSKINSVNQAGEQVMTVNFELDGQPVIALNAGPMFKFNEAFSFFVDCVDQAEVDDLWAKLTADGGEESQCGWLKDKFGLSWQIVPQRLMELLGDPDQGRASRAMEAMLKMQKIDVATLEAAAEGK